MTAPFAAVVLDSFGATLNSADPADPRRIVQWFDVPTGTRDNEVDVASVLFCH